MEDNGMAQHGVARRGVARRGVARRGMAQPGVVASATTGATEHGPTPSEPAGSTMSAVQVRRRQVSAQRLLRRLYACANHSLRAKLLACLVRPLSPLGLAAIAAGSFAVFLGRARDGVLNISSSEAARFSNESVGELGRFVEQVSPDALRNFANIVLENPVGIASFSAAAAVLLLHRLTPARRADEKVDGTST